MCQWETVYLLNLAVFRCLINTATKSIEKNKGKISSIGNSGTVEVGLCEAVKGVFGGKVTVWVLLYPLNSPKNT